VFINAILNNQIFYLQNTDILRDMHINTRPYTRFAALFSGPGGWHSTRKEV